MVPDVTKYICADRELHVELFCKGSQLPLPHWFHYGWSFCLTRKCVGNFAGYLKL